MSVSARAAVEADLKDIIGWGRRVPTRVGYFAALYSHVAAALEHELHVARGFQHPDLIEAVNEHFFHRYATAIRHHRRCAATTKAWGAAFAAAAEDQHVVVQHLLLGVNAHINFDLPIALAATVPPHRMDDFHPDFERMNDVIGSCVSGVIRDVARVWPLLRVVSRYAGGAEDCIIKFSLSHAREWAWSEALTLGGTPARRRDAAIRDLDARVTELAGDILDPGRVFQPVLLAIRATELGGIRAIIDDILD